MSSSLKLSTLSGGKKTKPVASKRKDASKPISEEEVLKKGTITPTDVCNLETYTKGTNKLLKINVLNYTISLFPTSLPKRVPVLTSRQYLRYWVHSLQNTRYGEWQCPLWDCQITDAGGGSIKGEWGVKIVLGSCETVARSLHCHNQRWW